MFLKPPYQHRTSRHVVLRIVSAGEHGVGVKTRYGIPKGTYIADYPGHVISTAEQEVLCSDYAVQLTKDKVLVSHKSENKPTDITHCINTACLERGELNNCAFSIHPRKTTAKIIATRDIRAHETLRIPYGRDYSTQLRRDRDAARAKRERDGPPQLQGMVTTNKVSFHQCKHCAKLFGTLSKLRGHYLHRVCRRKTES